MAKTKKKEESNDEVVISLDSFAVPGAILIAGVIIAVAVFFSNRNKGTEDIDDAGTDNTAEETDSAVDEEQFPAASADLGDAPYLGDRDSATVAIVEFSEYRCGYCERHKDETLPSIVENYVDTGKIVYVFRDFAIYGDDIANAAKCIYHLEDTDTFVEFHKLAFNLEDDDAIYALAKEVGVNESDFEACYSEKRYQDEIDADMAVGQAAGIQGTPGFVIGTIDNDGNVTGNLVPGAYPYENFVELLDGFLSE